MTNLMPIAEFCKTNEKYNTPQKVNYAIRKQEAPVDETQGKRMIDPEAWAEWEKTQATVSASKSPGGAGSRSSRPNSRDVEAIKQKHGIKEGTFMAWESGMYKDKISGGMVLNTFDEYCSTLIDDTGVTSPLRWDSIDRYIEEHKMVIVNYPEQLMFVLAAHFRQQGEDETAATLMELFKKHKTEEARV